MTIGSIPAIIDGDDRGMGRKRAAPQPLDRLLQGDDRVVGACEKLHARGEFLRAHEKEIAVMVLTYPDAVIAENAKPAPCQPPAEGKKAEGLGQIQNDDLHEALFISSRE